LLGCSHEGDAKDGSKNMDSESCKKGEVKASNNVDHPGLVHSFDTEVAFLVSTSVFSCSC